MIPVFPDKNNQIEVSSLNVGLYTMIIEMDGQVMSQKFVKM